jgi:hypothetical protein
MPGISKVMIGLGLLLLVCAVMAWSHEEPAIRAGVANGLAMIAAGVACAQGRRSVRLTGLFVGFLLPVLMLGVYTWRAAEQWRAHRAGAVSIRTPILLTFLALAVAAAVIALLKLRAAQQSSIAERGYSVTTPAHLLVPRESPPPTEHANRS